MYQKILYALSHDLHAPLRHIAAFNKLFVGSLEHELTDDQKQYQGFIENSVELLQIRLNILTSASRVYTKGTSFNNIDAESIIREQAAQFTNIDLNTIDIQAENDMKAPNVDHFIVLCKELLSNAIKFHHEGAEVKVSINASFNDNTFTLRVTDNGIGMPPERIEQAKLPFATLNGDDYPGDGRGLFLVNTVVEVYRGDIQFNTSPDKGCEVIITLPHIE